MIRSKRARKVLKATLSISTLVKKPLPAPELLSERSLESEKSVKNRPGKQLIYFSTGTEVCKLMISFQCERHLRTPDP